LKVFKDLNVIKKKNIIYNKYSTIYTKNDSKEFIKLSLIVSNKLKTLKVVNSKFTYITYSKEEKQAIRN